MPRDRAICMNSLSAGTVLTLLIASTSGTSFMSGGTKAIITPYLPALMARNAPSPVSHPELAVDGRGGAAPGPETQDEGKGLLGDQQLQPGRHGLGGLTRPLNDVVTGITRGQRRQRSFEGIDGWLIRLGFRAIDDSRPFGHHHQPVRPPG